MHIAGSDETASTIVLLHEGLGSVALWKDLPLQLRERTGCAILAYSRYGYGDSDPLAEKRPLDYMQHEGAVVLPELLSAMNIVKPILFGHSDGASIALIYAGFAPEAVHGAIVLAPHLFVEDISVASIAQAKIAYETTDLRSRLARYHADPDSAFRGWNDAWLDPGFRNWNIEAHVARIRCPILAIQGHDDEYGTPAQVEALAAHVPATRTLLLEHCGHSPHRDQREQTLAATTDFVAALLP